MPLKPFSRPQNVIIYKRYAWRNTRPPSHKRVPTTYSFIFSHHIRIYVNGIPIIRHICRSTSFKEDDGTWKGNEDGKVVNNQPQRVMDDRNGMMPQAGYIGR